MAISHEQAKALSRLVCQIRPDWDYDTTLTMIGRVREWGSVVDISIAAVRLAGNARNRTPEPLTRNGDHWSHVRPTALPSKVAKPDPSSLCGICSETEERCRQRWTGDHEFERVHQGRTPAPEHFTSARGRVTVPEVVGDSARDVRAPLDMTFGPEVGR